MSMLLTSFYGLIKKMSKLYREITKPVRKRRMMEGTIKRHNVTETGCDEDAYS
jgi:hypothetical protein